jgi:hypothetical protein
MYTEFGLELNNPDLNIYYIFCEKNFNTSEKGLLMGNRSTFSQLGNDYIFRRH